MIVNLRRLAGAWLFLLVLWSLSAFGLDPSLEVSQYAHTSWKIREGFATGTIHEIAQSPDGYLWLATESGLLRFDGVRTVPWQPPPGEQLPSNDIRALVAGRDGTLWLGTAKGLASWKDDKLSQFPQLTGYDVYTLLQDHEGTIWAAGVMWEAGLSQPGKLCAIKRSNVQCYGNDGMFSFGVTTAYEDSRGDLWLGAGNGLWRWRPGAPHHYELSGVKQSSLPALIFNRHALVEGERGSLLVAGPGGLAELVDGKLKPYPLSSAAPRLNEPGTLLRDRNGGLWIGTLDRGLLHVHQGRTDVFSQSDGLSGNAVESLFEDREGNVWVSTTAGLDRFREYAIPTISVKQGLSSPFVVCILAARDGSVWLGTTDGLNRWKDGQVTIYRKRSRTASTDTPKAMIAAEPPEAKQANPIQYVALPGNYIDSLYQDAQGRIWVSTHEGLGYFENDRFIPYSRQVTYAIPVTGDSVGNVWALSNEQGLCRLRVGRPVECVPRTELGSPGSFSDSLIADPVRGGFWLGFWTGGVVYFKDGEVRTSFGTVNGLGGGRVNALKLDADDTVWAATDGGLSRIKNGHIATLTSKNGLPCDTVHDLIDDDAHSLWVYTACGLVRVARSELDAWAANPQRKIQATVFDSSDGIRSHAGVYYPAPRVAKTADGTLWFLPLDGASFVDPRRLPFNKLVPPVYIEQATADGKVYDLRIGGNRRLQLPARLRNLSINFTALSFVDPEKVRFRFKLEGQDTDWREVINERHVEYSNLPPGNYIFRVAASNNSGAWNEQGDTFNFFVAPAYYQTNWFRGLCVAIALAALWGIYLQRIRRLRSQEKQLRDVINTIPANVWRTSTQGAVDFINQRWQELTGLPPEAALGWNWESVVHPDDRGKFLADWHAALQNGQTVESELRLRVANGEYRWFLIRAVALRDEARNILRWYGVLTDIEDLKRAEALIAGEKRILELVAKGNLLPEILESLCRLVEEQALGALASILLVEGDRLKHGGAPSLPKAYTQAIDGVLIGPCVGSCGTAAYRRQQVIVEDIATDPLWVDYRGAALPHSLRACWSTPIFSPEGLVIGTFAMYYREPRSPSQRDQEIIEQITHLAGVAIQRKLAEEKLQRSEAYLAESQRLTHTGSWAYKTAGGPLYWSEENFRIWGFQPHLGMPDLAMLHKRMHPEDRDREIAYAQRAARAGTDFVQEFRIVLPDGTTRHIHAVGHPVFSANGEVTEVVGTHVDVTERKRVDEEREKLRKLETELAHKNRLTMLGELASSLAHEINQPIAATITSANACLRWLMRDPPDLERARAATKRIEKDGTRAAEIVQRLRAFYKTGAPPQRELIDINEVVGEMLVLLRNEAIRHSVSLRTELSPKLPHALADRVQLQQVLMNLMLNGIEAMTQGPGELTIRSQRSENGWLLISVSDTGVGIPAEKVDLIFNAFYTTKAQGTGMGLAISRSIIEAHGGRLWVTAKGQRGATFQFTLPIEVHT